MPTTLRARLPEWLDKPNRTSSLRPFSHDDPLATAKPFLYGKELVLELQRRNDLPAALAIVIRSGQTIGLAGETQRFLQKVEFHVCAPPWPTRNSSGRWRLDASCRPSSSSARSWNI
ncbi:MAG: hypothetical protein ACRDYF_16625 [Acidimicrobiia bacterium]